MHLNDQFRNQILFERGSNDRCYVKAREDEHIKVADKRKKVHVEYKKVVQS